MATPSSEMPCPPGFRQQVAPETFMFDIITESPSFKRYKKFAEKHGLVRDVCHLAAMSDLDKINEETYLNVVQKSPLWLHLRNIAAGTASSVGKCIKGPPCFPTIEQISEAWREKINHAPFVAEHTTRGHMQWGVGYEDPALIHFACANMLSVAQVGTVRLPMSYIMETAKQYLSEEDFKVVQQARGLLPMDVDEHFLVSPDGVVGEPDEAGTFKEEDLPRKLVGMLEIKCISPFHHVETADGWLTWVDDMEKRQWHRPKEIPYVYLTQICMQSISGLMRLGMDGESTMWFMRWSPIGFSEFKIKFEPLIRMGVVSTLLFLMLKHRIKSEADLPLTYADYEMPVVRLLHKYYSVIMTNMEHRYFNHAGLYPEFRVYQKLTEFFKFKV
jgi:hypothetical protein